MALISWTDIKGIHDTIIDAFDAGMKSGKISYSTPERAAEYRNDALHVNEIVNAISDFVVGTNMSAQIQEYHPGATSYVEVHDSPDFKDEWYGFMIKFELCWSRDGVAVVRFEDRTISKDAGKDCGYNPETRKHSKTFFKHFGAEKWNNSEYYFKRETFVAAIPKMIKYFNKSNTLNRNRENNAKIINEIKQGLRKKEVKAIQFNTIAALAEEWVKGINPNLHVTIRDVSPKGSTTYSAWRLNIVNWRPAVWNANKIYNDNFHHLVSLPLDEHTQEGRYVVPGLWASKKHYNWVREWALDNIKNDTTFTAVEKDALIKETCREPVEICKLYSADPRFNPLITPDTHSIDLSFMVYLFYDKNYWNVKYNRKGSIPSRFQQLFAFGATTELENFEYVVEYMRHCLHVEDVLWKKADAQWHELADTFREDEEFKQFIATRNNYSEYGINTTYTGTVNPDTLIDNVNCLGTQGIAVDK